MKIFCRSITLTIVVLAAAGCIVTEEVNQPSDAPYSMTLPVPEGVATSGVWLAADCRVLRFSSTDFLRELGLRWQVAPAARNVEPATFALLTADQVSQLNEKGRGGVTYMPVPTDLSAFLLLKAGAPAVSSTPHFCLRSGGGKVLEIEVEAQAERGGQAFRITITASECDPREVPAPAKWVGSLSVSITGRYLLVDIPTARDHPAGTQSRVMVLLAPRRFLWRDGRHAALLPWGRERIITIKDRTIRTTWRPLEGR